MSQPGLFLVALFQNLLQLQLQQMFCQSIWHICILLTRVGHRPLSMKILYIDFFYIRFLTLVHLHQEPNVENQNYESLS